MPRPVDRPSSYLPSLDGVRALAVAAVVGYHIGVPWMPGGLLGVGVFFTLSGYLITTVLITGWDRTRRVGLRGFWVRRARRLLPALVMVLLVVLGATLVVDADDLAARFGESLAAMLYVSNWSTIAAGDSYFARVNGPGPLDHLWSLAVEEQFYLVWPVLLLALVVLLRGHLARVSQATLALALASFTVMWVVAAPGFDNTRAYEGTDTRAGALLVGAALAMVWRPGRMPRLRPAGRVVLDATGLAGLAGVAVLVATTDQYSMFLYRGGILLLTVATALLVGAVSHPASVLGRVIAVAPLRWVGERSYGIYLWHMPVVAFTPDGLLTDHPMLRGCLQVASSVGLAALSWTVVEDPIRRAGVVRSLRRRGFIHGGARRPLPAVVAGAIALTLVGVTTLSTTAQAGGTRSVSALATPLDPPVPPDAVTPVAVTPVAVPAPTPDAVPAPTATPPEPTTTAVPTTPTTPTTPTAPRASSGSSPATPVTAPNRPSAQTSCTSVVHVGDSTSVGLMDKGYLPDAGKRLDAQYRRVGATTFSADILGARSIVERYRDQPNAEQAVTSREARGYAGCWVLAMGTNEVANQYVGGTVPLDQRIDRLMQPIGDRPVLWLTVKSLRPSGPWADGEMQKWNQALVEACSRYRDMRVYDWRSEVQDAWFIGDGIHFTSAGYAQRAERVADALARAFPVRGSSPSGCLVSSGD